MKEDSKNPLIKYAIAILAASSMSGVVLWLRDIGMAETLADRYKILADAFTVPGVILMLFSGLIWVANDGFFDGLSYTFTRIGHMFLPFVKGKHQTYYDYKESKKDRPKHPFFFLFAVGAVFTVVAIVFNLLYNSVV